MNDVSTRVAAGAAFLDEKNPGWRKRIDIEELQMSSETRCILGQLYGDYLTGTRALHGLPILDWGIQHGFEGYDLGPDYCAHPIYAELDAAWKQELAR